MNSEKKYCLGNNIHNQDFTSYFNYNRVLIKLFVCFVCCFFFLNIQTKHWGFLLREVFGDRLGTGDYGHLTIEHTSMLFRKFRSFTRYSNQGFEALHRMQRQCYTRSTNHDGKAFGKSSMASITFNFLNFQITLILIIYFQKKINPVIIPSAFKVTRPKAA